jgi:hypothetical protein
MQGRSQSLPCYGNGGGIVLKKKETILLLLPQFLVTLESELDVHHESFTVLKYVFQETGT